MNIKVGTVVLRTGLHLVMTIALLGVASSAFAQASSVKNKTYDVQVSIGNAHDTPFHDCARFTSTQMCLDACASPRCGPLTEVNLGSLTIWQARIGCGGFNLEIVGTSQNGINDAAIGASIKGKNIGANGLEGIENPSCSLN
jgi:hypothetical protein